MTAQMQDGNLERSSTGGRGRWAVTAACVLSALVIRWALAPFLKDTVPYFLFAPAAMLSAWLGGFWPGVVAMLVGGALANFYFVDPHGSPSIPNSADFIRLSTYLLTTSIAIVICESLHRARRRADMLALQSEAQAEDLRREISRRARLEEAQHAVESRYHALFDTSVDGILVTDDEGRYVDVNDAFCRMLKSSREQLIGQHFDRFIPPEMIREAKDAFAKLQSGQSLMIEFPLQGADGSLVELEWTSRVNFVPGLHLYVSRDISERKRAQGVAQEQEQLLRQSERRYRFLADSIPQIVWTARPDGVTNYNNRWLFDYFGTKPEQMQKLGWTPFRHPDDREHATELWLRCVKTGEPYECTYRLLRGSDRTWRWHLARAVPMWDENGKIIAWFGTCTDIDDQKRAEDQLRSSEEEFRAVFELAGSGKALSDPQTGRFVRVNRKLCEMLGYSSEELLQINPDQLTHEEDRLWCRDLFDRVMRGQKQIFSAERRYIRNDGQAIWTHVTITAIRDADGHAIRAASVIHDITDQKRVQAELQAASRAKDQFLATLSHELRTPLTPVVLTLGALLNDPSLPEHLREDVRTIERNVGLETKLIDDLLDLTRIARGKLELRPQIVDLHALLDYAVRTCCGGEVLEKQLKVDFDFCAKKSRVRGDPLRLDQIFFNLLRNAVKFTPAGGGIRLSTRTARQGWITIEVADNGIGIDPDVLPRIFNAFEQGDPSVTRQFGGLGLGLAVSKALVDLHGGTIQAHSAGKDQGASFIIEMPVVDTALLEDGSEPRDGSGTLRNLQGSSNLKILLVEDHEQTAQIMARLLRSNNVAVLAAGNVDSAKKLAECNQFDLVVSDLGLPDGSGLELMNYLRQRYGLKGIALTGFGMEEDLRHSKAAGFLEHLVKPVTFDDLQAAITRVTSGAMQVASSHLL